MRLDVEPSGLERKSIAASQLDREYVPTKNELLFWLGFPGSKAMRHEPVTELKTR
jgi:hypothetical protein